MPLTAVIGAGGPIGQLCVQQLLQAGDTVRAVVRSPDKFERQGIKHDNLHVVAGDVTDAASLQAALQGADSCIFAAAGATYLGARAVEDKVHQEYAALSCCLLTLRKASCTIESLSHTSQLQGVQNLAAVAGRTGTHVVLVSAALVTPKNWYHPARILLNNVVRYNMMTEKVRFHDLSVCLGFRPML